MRSSLSRSEGAGGDAAVEAGDNVAIGGKAICWLAEWEVECPEPIGRGWGGKTAGNEGLGG